MSGPKAAIIPNRLSPTQRQKLKVSLGKGLSNKQINLIEGVLIKTAVEQQLYDKATENLTKADTKIETKLLLNNLNFIIKTLQSLPSLSENHLNTCYFIAKGGKEEYAPEIHVPQFLSSASDMQKAVEIMHENPLPTNDRKNRFTNSLELIANRFLKVFPKNKVAYSKETTFYKLIKYWHLYVLCSGFKDPKRQIIALIESREKHTTT